jgi:putative ergosteryl-3beta-O-L-aspartate hydrolase
VGLVVFYGRTDRTQSLAEREASNPNLIHVIPRRLFELFDQSYYYPMPDKTSPLLSPGLAPDQLIRNALPENLVLINCGGDPLLAQSEQFRARLQGLGKRVGGCIVEGVGHAWDKRDEWRDMFFILISISSSRRT